MDDKENKKEEEHEVLKTFDMYTLMLSPLLS